MTYKQKKCNRIDFVMAREAEIEMARAENGLPAIERGVLEPFLSFDRKGPAAPLLFRLSTLSCPVIRQDTLNRERVPFKNEKARK